MGNARSAEQPLALTAIGNKLSLRRIQIQLLRDAMASYADSEGYVDKSCFLSSLARANITDPEDLEIFELLFIMWDSFGTDRIPYTAFTVGVSTLACPNDEVVSVLRFALQIQDEANTGRVCAKSLLELLHWIHATASYFGDAQLETGDIAAIVETVFDMEKSTLTHATCAKRLQANAYVKRFVSGKTRSRVRFNEDLLTVATDLGEGSLLDKVMENSAFIDQVMEQNTFLDQVMGQNEFIGQVLEQSALVGKVKARDEDSHGESRSCEDDLWTFDKCLSPRGAALDSLLDDSRDSWDSILSDDSPSTGSFSKRTKVFGKNQQANRYRSVNETPVRAE